MLWFIPSVSFLYIIFFFFCVFFIRGFLNKQSIAPVPLKVGAVMELIVAGTGFLAINDLQRALTILIIGAATRAGLVSFYEDNIALYGVALCIALWLLYKKCFFRVSNYLDPIYSAKQRSLANFAPISHHNVKKFVSKSYIPETSEVEQLRLQEMKNKIAVSKNSRPSFEKIIGSNYRYSQKPLHELSDKELIALHRQETYPVYGLIAAAMVSSSSSYGLKKDHYGRDELDYQMDDFQREVERTQDDAFRSFHDDHFH